MEFFVGGLGFVLYGDFSGAGLCKMLTRIEHVRMYLHMETQASIVCGGLKINRENLL